MKIYFDKDECYTTFFCEEKTVYDTEGTDIPDDLWKTYESLDRAYWNLISYMEKLMEIEE
jgi:hypothetical protein